MATLILRDFPNDLHMALKVAAAKKRTSMKAILIEAAREWVEREKESAMEYLRIKEVQRRGRGSHSYVVIFERPERVQTRDGKFTFIDRIQVHWPKSGTPITMCVIRGNTLVDVTDFSRSMLLLNMSQNYGETPPAWAETRSGRELWLWMAKEFEPFRNMQPLSEMGGEQGKDQAGAEWKAKGPPA